VRSCLALIVLHTSFTSEHAFSTRFASIDEHRRNRSSPILFFILPLGSKSEYHKVKHYASGILCKASRPITNVRHAYYNQHMPTKTKRELNQNTASVLAQVTDVSEVVVTERGKPRWRITQYHAQDTLLARLERDGRYTPPASLPTPWPDKPGGPKYTDDEVQTLLDEMRGDH